MYPDISNLSIFGVYPLMNSRLLFILCISHTHYPYTAELSLSNLHLFYNLPHPTQYNHLALSVVLNHFENSVKDNMFIILEISFAVVISIPLPLIQYTIFVTKY